MKCTKVFSGQDHSLNHIVRLRSHGHTSAKIPIHHVHRFHVQHCEWGGGPYNPFTFRPSFNELRKMLIKSIDDTVTYANSFFKLTLPAMQIYTRQGLKMNHHGDSRMWIDCGGEVE